MAKIIVNKRLDKEANQFYNIETIKIDLESMTEESDLVRKIKNRFGAGKYNLMLVKKGLKGFRQVWYGEIAEDSYRREKGKIVQYMDNIEKENRAPRQQWTNLDDTAMV